MTKPELRVLYLLQKHGGTCGHSTIAQAMARSKKRDREAALANLETMELVSSARKPAPSHGGFGALVYWLTDAGNKAVDHLIECGDLQDPRARS